VLRNALLINAVTVKVRPSSAKSEQSTTLADKGVILTMGHRNASIQREKEEKKRLKIFKDANNTGLRILIHIIQQQILDTPFV
jgi:hypothetical protein